MNFAECCTYTFCAPRAAWYSVFLNSLVHVFMYAYYFAATALGANPAARRRYLWWGRYLTQFQVRGAARPGVSLNTLKSRAGWQGVTMPCLLRRCALLPLRRFNELRGASMS